MASIRQRSGKWQARVVRKGFPDEVQTFATKTEAQQWARAIEANMEGGRYKPTAKTVNAITLHDLLERYLHEVSPSKKGWADEIIRIKALKRRRIAQYAASLLTPERVAQFREERLRTVQAGAVIRDLSLLSSVINHARREWGLTISNPCELVRKPPSPRGRSRLLSKDEEVRLVAALKPEGRRNTYMPHVVALALATAMRRGELLGMTWENVDLDRQTIFLPDTKNGSSRTVPLSSGAIAVLAAIPRPEGCEKVFPLAWGALEKAFRLACLRAGIEDLRFHDLRHTATSRMAGRLPNVIELSAVTGHRTLQMLKRYYHPRAEDLAKKLG